MKNEVVNFTGLNFFDLLAFLDGGEFHWEYEDNLPDDVDYDLIFSASKVDIVRVFPYLLKNGTKYWLTTQEI